MNRKALLALSLLATTLVSCGTARRFGKDVMLGVGTPVLMVYGGATDGYTSARNVREGMGSSAVVEVLAFPFTFTYNAIKHGIYGIIHVIDAPLCLFYGAAELHPQGPEIQPLDFYQGTFFDKKASSTDAQSGESMQK
ncbi:MAG: hypothetical protein H6838_19985 [Planctomycetes bacterium]|nr:hypothetical protein [Planctomycetota bacterium]MCB9887776.1 hypothetical protein [Planctomycetota bacterium]